MTPIISSPIILSLAKNIIEKSADFLPTDLPDLIIWLDAADVDTITETGGSVEQWDDKSGENNNATQSVGTAQPITDLKTINGINAISFDIVNDRLELPDISIFDNFLSTGGTITLVSQSYSLGESDVGRFLDKAFKWRINKISAGTGALGLNVKFSGVDANFQTADGSFPVPIPGTPSAPSDPTILTIKYDGSNLTQPADFFVNGSLQTLSSSTLPTGIMEVDNQGPLRIGGRHIADRSVDADLGEIILCDREINTSERTKLENYLSNKWAIPL